MRNLMILAASVVLLVVLNSGAVAGKTCIVTATEALPKITGLVVKRSRTRPVSPEISGYLERPVEARHHRR